MLHESYMLLGDSANLVSHASTVHALHMDYYYAQSLIIDSLFFHHDCCFGNGAYEISPHYFQIPYPDIPITLVDITKYLKLKQKNFQEYKVYAPVGAKRSPVRILRKKERRAPILFQGQ